MSRFFVSAIQSSLFGLKHDTANAKLIGLSP
jgi:hypothetical protein